MYRVTLYRTIDHGVKYSKNGKCRLHQRHINSIKNIYIYWQHTYTHTFTKETQHESVTGPISLPQLSIFKLAWGKPLSWWKSHYNLVCKLITNALPTIHSYFPKMQQNTQQCYNGLFLLNQVRHLLKDPMGKTIHLRWISCIISVF